jgi:hypothetical protein
MSNALISQISKNLLFRYRIPCAQIKKKPTGKFDLGNEYQIPSFGALEGQKEYATIQMGWMDDGLYVVANVEGKKQPLRCREVDLTRSDAVYLWLDTRATHNVHRATKYCHWMILMPTGSGAKQEQPVGRMIKINRCKEDSPAMNRAKLVVESSITKTGYKISAHIPSACLFGWDTKEHRNIGFNYAVSDHELGWQTLAVGIEFPMMEDPSLWQTLSLEA